MHAAMIPCTGIAHAVTLSAMAHPSPIISQIFSSTQIGFGHCLAILPKCHPSTACQTSSHTPSTNPTTPNPHRKAPVGNSA